MKPEIKIDLNAEELKQVLEPLIRQILQNELNKLIPTDYSKQDAARLLHISRPTLNRLIERRIIKTNKLGRIPYEEIIRLKKETNK
jgi:predicted XRE-type DNA-binding protein